MSEDITCCLNNLCIYITRYRSIVINNQVQRIDYSKLNAQTFKSFKGNDCYKKYYNPIVEFINKSSLTRKEIAVDNLVKILIELFKTCDREKIEDTTFTVIEDLSNEIHIGGNAVINDEKILVSNLKNDLLSKFELNIEEVDLTTQQMSVNAAAINAINIIGDTQNLESDNNSPNTDNLSVNRTDTTVVGNDASILEVLRKIIRQETNQILLNHNSNSHNGNISCNKSISSANTKKLTMSEVNNIRQKAYYKYEKLLKTEHHLSLFKTHIDNNTNPLALNFNRFPKPFFSDDPIYVDEHNSIIKEAQNKFKKAIENRCKTMIDSTNIELAELKSSLDSYEGNKERFFDNIKSTVTNDLRQFFESGNQKLLRLNKNYFEDHLSTEYEVVNKTTDDFQREYLSLTNETDSQYTTKSNKVDPKYQSTDAEIKRVKNYRNDYSKNNNRLKHQNTNNGQFQQRNNYNHNNHNNRPQNHQNHQMHQKSFNTKSTSFKQNNSTYEKNDATSNQSGVNFQWAQNQNWKD